MFILVSIIYYVFAALSAPANTKKELVYLQATVLFYKNNKGQLDVANGTVPEEADLAIRNDIASRFQEAIVRIVPIFNQSIAMSETLNIIDFVKDEYRTVFVTELPKNGTRKIGKGLQEPYDINLSSVEIVSRELRLSAGVGNDECDSCQQDTDESSSNETNKISENKPTKKPHDDVVLSDIYYGIEKKCVNWADDCNLQSKNILQRPSKYIRPKIAYGSLGFE